MNDINNSRKGVKQVNLIPTKISNLEIGDIVVGPCGHERVVREITKYETVEYHIKFKNTAKKWCKKSNEIALLVKRFYDTESKM